MRSLPAQADLLRRRLDELPRRSPMRLMLDALSLWRDETAGVGTAASFHAVLAMAGVLLLGTVWDRSPSAWMALLAGGIALGGAAGGFTHLRRALNAYDRSGAVPVTFDPFMRTRVAGFAVLCAGGLAALALLAGSVMLPSLARRLPVHPLLAGAALALSLWLMGSALLGALLAAMLRTMPDAPASQHAVRVASASAAMVFAAVTVMLGLHLSGASPASPERLTEAAVIAVLWTCACTQGVLLAGALAAQIDRTQPRRVVRTQPQAPTSQPPSDGNQATSIALARARRLQRLARPRHVGPPCVVLQFPVGRRRR
jgi:hypothetical protein